MRTARNWEQRIFEPGTTFLIRDQGPGFQVSNNRRAAAYAGDVAGSMILAPLLASTATQIGAGLYNAAVPEALNIPAEGLANLAALGAMGYGAYKGIARFHNAGSWPGFMGKFGKFADQATIVTPGPKPGPDAGPMPVSGPGPQGPVPGGGGIAAASAMGFGSQARRHTADSFADPLNTPRDADGLPLDPAYRAVELALTREERASINPEQYNRLYQQVSQRMLDTGNPERAAIYAENEALERWLNTPEGKEFDARTFRNAPVPLPRPDAPPPSRGLDTPPPFVEMPVPLPRPDAPPPFPRVDTPPPFVGVVVAPSSAGKTVRDVEPVVIDVPAQQVMTPTPQELAALAMEKEANRRRQAQMVSSSPLSQIPAYPQSVSIPSSVAPLTLNDLRNNPYASDYLTF